MTFTSSPQQATCSSGQFLGPVAHSGLTLTLKPEYPTLGSQCPSLFEVFHQPHSWHICRSDSWGLQHLYPPLSPDPQPVTGHITLSILNFPGGSDGKDSACNALPGSIPGLGRSPIEGNGNSLQYSCLDNPMDRGTWWATAHGVPKSRIQLSD